MWKIAVSPLSLLSGAAAFHSFDNFSGLLDSDLTSPGSVTFLEIDSSVSFADHTVVVGILTQGSCYVSVDFSGPGRGGESD